MCPLNCYTIHSMHADATRKCNIMIFPFKYRTRMVALTKNCTTKKRTHTRTDGRMELLHDKYLHTRNCTGMPTADDSMRWRVGGLFIRMCVYRAKKMYSPRAFLI